MRLRTLVWLGVFWAASPLWAATPRPAATPARDAAQAAGSTLAAFSGVTFDESRMTVADVQAPPEPDAADADQPLLDALQRPDPRVLNPQPESLLAANENASRRLESRLPVEPWLDAVAKPPILKVYPSIQKGVEVREWRFSIMDDAGNTLWTQQQRGSIPACVTWDGRVTKGGMIDVEIPFFFTLGALDLGGNPIFMSGPSQSLTALAYLEDRKLMLRLSTARLFRSGKDSVLTDAGESLLRECLNEISKARYTAFQVTAFANNDKLADLQAEAVIRHLMRELTLPREAFALQHQNVNDRFKVEILCKP